MVTVAPFTLRLRSALAAETSATTRKLAARSNVYPAGSRDDRVYLIATGHVKLIMQSPEGKECLLAIYSAGDFFGECCFSGAPRSETAVTMTDTVVRQVAGSRFLTLLVETGLMPGFIRHLSTRLSELQQTITSFATVDCEYRLAALLLRLVRKLGTDESHGLPQKISHQELSQMVGTTRPRISEFMQRFRERGLIESTADSRIIVRDQRIEDYLRARGLDAGCQTATA